MGRKSRSRRRSKEISAIAPESAPAATGHHSDPRRGSALSRELADFLVEFSIVLNKRSMYPAGHPQLHAAAERFARRLHVLLETRESIMLGVARHRLVIESVTTDPNNALLRELAQRLHRHRVGSVHLIRGVTLDEIESLLVALSTDPQRGEGPLGMHLERAGSWRHIRLRTVGYDKLTLQDEERAAGPATEPAEAGAEAIRDP
ncbi:MAG TPA: hypothetical protein VFU40_02380, partial [Gemmatimonadales bacterium]|nr:hypothetical protein [Gemmatimonadales bacterium]